jgi:hypothetical protein
LFRLLWRALEVSRLKVIILSVALLFSISISANELKPLCEIPRFYQKYFELNDFYSFTDNDFNEDSVAVATKQVTQKTSPIPDNDLSIITGGQLQKNLLKAKKKFKLSKSNKHNVEDSEAVYLKAKFDYCEFIIHTRKIDW